MKTLASLPWRGTKTPLPAPEEDEHSIDSCSTHWIKYVLPVAISLLIGSIGALIIGIGLTMFETGTVQFLLKLVGLLFIVCIHHWFFYIIMSHSMTDVIITNKRLVFIEDFLFFKGDVHEVRLANVLAVEVHQRGVIQNVFDIGELWFDTGGTSINAGRVLKNIPDPHKRSAHISRILKKQ